MRFAQVRNILDQARDFHGQLADYYGQLSNKGAQQRINMLLDYMSSHERSLQKGLAAYEDDASRQVLDTWVDSSHSDDIVATCAQMTVAPTMSVEGVIKVAMDVDRCLLHFYREVARTAESEMVREVFRNLIEMEEAEMRNLALNALRAMDI